MALGRPFSTRSTPTTNNISSRPCRSATLGTYDEEYRIVRPDGTVRWVRDRAFPIRNGSGAVYRVAGIADDVTERKASGGGAVRGQARGGSGQQGQGRVPRQHEPRDSDADECGDRHDQPPARHRAEVRAARVSSIRFDRAARRCSRSSTTSSTFRRSKPGCCSSSSSRSTCASCVEGALDLVAPKAAEKNLDLAYVMSVRHPGRPGDGRHARPPDSRQSSEQCREVHGARRESSFR